MDVGRLTVEHVRGFLAWLRTDYKPKRFSGATHPLSPKSLRNWFGVGFEFLIYDVTSTFFESQALGNTKAARGYSRDRRPDCKQVGHEQVGPEGCRWLGSLCEQPH